MLKFSFEISQHDNLINEATTIVLFLEFWFDECLNYYKFILFYLEISYARTFSVRRSHQLNSFLESYGFQRKNQKHWTK